MQAQKHFQTSTLLFYQNKLEQALLAINQSIHIKPTSLSFNNRAIINYHLTKPSHAREDLSMSLSIDHLNYTAYFNLSSFDIRQHDISSSIDNLTCAISALKLIYGRIKKQRLEVLNSLELCHNNFDALILLILMEISHGNFQDAINLINKYERYQEDKLMMNKIRSKVQQLLEKYSFQCEESLYDLLQEEIKQGRLQSSIKMKNRLLEEQQGPVLSSKLQEFNKYYELVNKSQGKIQHLPKPSESYLMMDHPTWTKVRQIDCSSQNAMVASH